MEEVEATRAMVVEEVGLGNLAVAVVVAGEMAVEKPAMEVVKMAMVAAMEEALLEEAVPTHKMGQLEEGQEEGRVCCWVLVVKSCH